MAGLLTAKQTHDAQTQHASAHLRDRVVVYLFASGGHQIGKAMFQNQEQVGQNTTGAMMLHDADFSRLTNAIQ